MRSLSSVFIGSPVTLLKACLVILASAFLSACNVLGLQAPWDDDQTPDYNLISQNLIDAVAQFPHLNPPLSTVQVSKPGSIYAQHIQQGLSDRGYKLQPASDSDNSGDDAANIVKTQVNQVVRPGVGKQNLYVLAVGDISVERAYDTVAGKTVPVSELTIRGMEQQTVQLNDDIFEVPDSPFSKVVYQPVDAADIRRNYSKKEILSEPKITPALPAPQAERFATAPEPEISPALPATASLAERFSAPSNNAIKHNMYENMVSNYANVFEEYDELERQTLIFPNDSLRIGESNKSIIEQLAAKMNPETDILSVIGCSHGNTEYTNGNSLLALGRANRVKESFLFLGMEHDQVLEEGCWAPVLFDEMPKRGVVVTLKRRKPA